MSGQKSLDPHAGLQAPVSICSSYEFCHPG